MCENHFRLQIIHAEANGVNIIVNDPETKVSSLYDVERCNKKQRKKLATKNEGDYKRARDDLAEK